MQTGEEQAILRHIWQDTAKSIRGRSLATLPPTGDRVGRVVFLGVTDLPGDIDWWDPAFRTTGCRPRRDPVQDNVGIGILTGEHPRDSVRDSPKEPSSHRCIGLCRGSTYSAWSLGEIVRARGRDAPTRTRDADSCGGSAPGGRGRALRRVSGRIPSDRPKTEAADKNDLTGICSTRTTDRPAPQAFEPSHNVSKRLAAGGPAVRRRGWTRWASHALGQSYRFADSPVRSNLKTIKQRSPLWPRLHGTT